MAVDFHYLHRSKRTHKLENVEVGHADHIVDSDHVKGAGVHHDGRNHFANVLQN